MTKIKHKSAGYTLMELLTVITILGIMIGIISLGITSTRSKARDTKLIVNTSTIKDALKLYYYDNQTYPPCLTDGGTVKSDGLDCEPEDALKNPLNYYFQWSADYPAIPIKYQRGQSNAYLLVIILENSPWVCKTGENLSFADPLNHFPNPPFGLCGF